MMKRFISLALITLAAILTGCDKKAVTDILSQGQTTTFTVSAAPQTRAAGADLSRYIMEIYAGTSAAGEPIAHTEQDNGTFNVKLNHTQDYTILFWGDNGTADTHDTDGGYNAADLKKVTINGRASEAGYAGVTRFNMSVDDPADYTRVTLTHAVAKISYVQSEVFPENDNTLAVTFPRSYTLNTDDMNVAEIKNGDASVPATHTFAGITAGTAATTFAESYIFASAGSKMLTDISLTFNDEQPKEVTNIPVQCNYNTNLKGSYSDFRNSTISISCEEDWNTPDHEKPFQIGLRKISDDGGNGAPVYEIHTAHGLKAFADLINGAGTDYDFDGIQIPATSTPEQRKSNAILAKDIDLSELCGAEIGNWKLIGAQNTVGFAGTFDGNGKTISNLYINDQTDRTSVTEGGSIYYGLFGLAAKNSVIKDLTVTGTITFDNKGYKDVLYVGGIAGSARIITNCHSFVNITAKLTNQDAEQGGFINVGGIVGSIGYGNLTGCTSSSKVKAEYYAPANNTPNFFCSAGGLAGHAYETNINGCRNSTEGSVQAYSDNDEVCAGGIVGWHGHAGIFGCTNSSAVSGQAQNSSIKNFTSIGGISGACDHSTIAVCYNQSAVTILSGTAYYKAGGIVGNFKSFGVYACYTELFVVDQTEGATAPYKGAIIGALDQTSNTCSASQCWYIGKTELGKNGIGAFLYYDNLSENVSNTDGGRVSEFTQVNYKVNDMNAAVKTYNEGAEAGKECPYHFVEGATTPVIKPGAPE